MSSTLSNYSSADFGMALEIFLYDTHSGQRRPKDFLALEPFNFAITVAHLMFHEGACHIVTFINILS